MSLRMLGFFALIIGLGVSLGFNIFAAVGTPTVVGVADSKSIGRGLDERGEPLQWYTVSLELVTDDEKNDLPVGATMDYIVDKEDWGRVEDGSLVKGSLKDDLKMDIETVTFFERFNRGDDRFNRHEDSQ